VVDSRTPCIIGVAQRVVRPAEGPAPEPLELWAEVARGAAEDANGKNILAAVDDLNVVFTQSWPYDDPAGRLATALQLSPGNRFYSGLGGTVPQTLLAGAAEKIMAGESRVSLLVGAEALATVRRAKKAGERLPWSHRRSEKAPFPFEAPFHPAEVAHEVFHAYLTFAMRDVARRAARGSLPDAYRTELAEQWSGFSEVAAENPYAWFPTVRSAQEIGKPSPDNRMIAYPYTKYMTSVMDVDMAGAVILASTAAADEMGVPAEQRVYLRSWAYGTDPVYVAEHPDLARSPAMSAVFGEALAGAGIGLDEVNHLDLYSCFSSSVNFAKDALGLDTNDGRKLTVTGGLPYHGGPGSAFGTHSLGDMVRTLRADPGSTGLVTAVGMHMTKHAATVLSTTPGTPGQPDPQLQERLDDLPRKTIATGAIGPATIATFSTVHDREGNPTAGVLVCDLPTGDRGYARVVAADQLGSFETDELVGAAVELSAGADGVTLAELR
jgi:acetyl-CoA C-acetyltransferase